MGFLHVFHHLVTMLYCLHATIYSVSADATGIFFCGVNLFVHTLMYGYYALVALGLASLKGYGFILSILQTMQMVLGIVVILTANWSCPSSWNSNWHGQLFAFGMYAVYLYLFFDLTWKKLFQKRKKLA